MNLCLDHEAIVDAGGNRDNGGEGGESALSLGVAMLAGLGGCVEQRFCLVHKSLNLPEMVANYIGR